MSDMYNPEASSARLPPGTRLNGIFEVEERIGSGGMGDIYRGHVIETGDAVAIKLLRTDLTDTEAALALFRKEASALHSIHHEAIVRYYVFSSDPVIRRLYLAMEFVDGSPLSDLLKQGPLSFEAVRLLQQRLAAGLHAAHERGIIHRDVSPDNILIPGRDLGRAKIIDFGIARTTQLGQGTIIGSGFAGKYNYVSPEQLGLFGGDVTAKSDIYSLGLVLAECLNGRAIDMSGSQFEVIEKRRTLPPLETIDPRFLPLLERMLQPDPRDRPESMAEIASWRPDDDSLRTVIAPARARGPAQPPQQATPAPPDVPPRGAVRQATPGPQPVSRSRLWPAGLALVLLAALGGGGYILYGNLAQPATNPTEVRVPELDPGIAQRRQDEALRRAAEEAARKQDEEKPKQQIEANAGPASTFPSIDRPANDVRERIGQFVAGYDGGDCFFVAPVTVAEGKAILDGYGSSVAPFEVLDYEFKRQNGFEATIGLHQVTTSQCAAVSFLAQTRRQRGTPPHLDVSAAAVRSGSSLTGSITGFDDRNVDLLLVADDGFVENLASLLRTDGDPKSFSVRLQKNEPGPAQPQLLIAIVSSGQMEWLKGPKLGKADDVFARLRSEAAKPGQSFNVSSKYFKLDNEK